MEYLRKTQKTQSRHDWIQHPDKQLGILGRKKLVDITDEKTYIIIQKKYMSRNRPLFIEIGQGLSLMAGLPTIVTWDTQSKPKKPKQGTIGFNIQTNNLEFWDGKSWFVASLSKS